MSVNHTPQVLIREGEIIIAQDIKFAHYKNIININSIRLYITDGIFN